MEFDVNMTYKDDMVGQWLLTKENMLCRIVKVKDEGLLVVPIKQLNDKEVEQFERFHKKGVAM